jgi:hypothetical protein
LGHPVPGGYKYGDLALQVGGVKSEQESIIIKDVRYFVRIF